MQLKQPCSIAEHGADAFYSGKIANNTVAAATARGGIITLKDLADYSTIIREPVNISVYTPFVFKSLI